MAVPRLEKVVVNMGVGEATQNAKVLDPAVAELAQITGQKPVVTKAKKWIAAFKVREGMPIGCMVTLRGDRMYEFLDRLMNVALPRVRDFRGVSNFRLGGEFRELLVQRNAVRRARINRVADGRRSPAATRRPPTPSACRAGLSRPAARRDCWLSKSRESARRIRRRRLREIRAARRTPTARP